MNLLLKNSKILRILIINFKVKLFFRKYGSGKPLIIAHGLYGMSDNWLNIAKPLSEIYEVFLIDLRNHGNSPHSDEHSYPLISQDIAEFLSENSIKKASFVGHSMGGKAVMNFAFDFPQSVENMIVVDISPRQYIFNEKEIAGYLNHYEIMKMMHRTEFNNFQTREQIEKHLSGFIPDTKIVKFLIKNIKRNSENKFEWKINISALLRNFKKLFEEVGRPDDVFSGKTLFIKAENSPYISEADTEIIKRKFPNSQIRTMPECGHWVHYEKPAEMIEIISKFS